MFVQLLLRTLARERPIRLRLKNKSSFGAQMTRSRQTAAGILHQVKETRRG
jgi:hypothetical protein